VNGIIRVGDRSNATAWVYHFMAVATDLDGSASDVPIVVHIKGEGVAYHALYQYRQHS